MFVLGHPRVSGQPAASRELPVSDATADAGATSVAPPSRAEQLLRQAIDALDRHRSVRAKVRHRVDLFEQQLVGAGTYLQGSRSSLALRLELKIQLSDRVTSLQQICDGRYLWIDRHLKESPNLTRVDVARVLKAHEAAGTGLEGTPLGSPLAVGGLPGLLQGLDRSFQFTSVFDWQLNGLPVYGVRGQWEPNRLNQLLPNQQEAIEAGRSADLSKLPMQLPDHVVVFLGRDDLFPYRIEYRRQAGSARGRRQGSSRPLLVLELFEVQFNVPIDPALFAYEPGDRSFTDQTDQYIRNLELAR
jgi:hypothetical protein